MRTRIRSLTLLSVLRFWRGRELWCSCKRGSDLALLCLWRRPAATALLRPLAWERPYAAGAALGKTKKKKSSTRHSRGNGTGDECPAGSLLSGFLSRWRCRLALRLRGGPLQALSSVFPIASLSTRLCPNSPFLGTLITSDEGPL